LQEALRQIIASIGHPDIEKELLDLWFEYEEGNNPEGEVARQLDKFEMIVQADEYEKSHPGKKLESFFHSTKDSFTHPEVTETNFPFYFNNE
jgi:putative hydrolase of HD superfamily